MAKRNKYSRWRRLPGGLSRTSRRQFPDVDDEPQPLTLFLPASSLDAAEQQAVRAGAATVQEYCAGLLRRLVDEQRVRDQFADVEARRGALEGLNEIANDPEYLAEWNAQAARLDRDRPSDPPPVPTHPDTDRPSSGITAGQETLPSDRGPLFNLCPGDITPGSEVGAESPAFPSAGLDRVGPDQAPGPRLDGPASAPASRVLSASAEIVMRHAGRVEAERATFLNSLRRGETLDLAAVAELARALREVEAEYGDAMAVDRRLAFALHRLAFEGQILLTDSWPGAFDTWTIDALRAVQESVDRILSGLDIRYYATESRPENLY